MTRLKSLGSGIDVPRDTASGQATGKRTHGPVRIRAYYDQAPPVTPGGAKITADAMVDPATKKKVSITGRRKAVDASAAGLTVDPELAAAANAAVRGAGSSPFNGKYLIQGATHRAQGAGGATAFATLLRNPIDDPLKTGTGPISRAEWKSPESIVARMTQNSNGLADLSGEARCGPTNLLAIELLQGGQAGAAKLLESSAAKAGPYLSSSDARELKRIAGAIRKGTASFEDLSKAQELLYSTANRETWLGDAKDEALASGNLSADEARRLEVLSRNSVNLDKAGLRELSELLTAGLDRDVTVQNVTVKGFEARGTQTVVTFKDSSLVDKAGLSDGELARAASRGGLSAKQVTAGAAGSVASGALGKLKAGESAIIRVAIDGTSTQPNHYVTVGKLKDGRPFVYNPDPSKGDATLVIGSKKDPQPAEFSTELAKYDARSTKQTDRSNPMDLGVLPPMTIVR